MPVRRSLSTDAAPERESRNNPPCQLSQRDLDPRLLSDNYISPKTATTSPRF